MATSRLEHLWAGANVLLARAPTVSRLLASRLAASTMGPDGMSATARRLHCSACGGLLAPNARVRVQARSKQRKRDPRSVKRKRRSRDALARNHVLRTCAACFAVNRNVGLAKTGDWENVGTALGTLHSKNTCSQELNGDRSRFESSGVREQHKRKKRQNLRVSNIAGPGELHHGGPTAPSSIAASFLFKPL